MKYYNVYLLLIFLEVQHNEKAKCTILNLFNKILVTLIT